MEVDKENSFKTPHWESPANEPYLYLYLYLYLLTLNSSYTLLMLLVSAFPRMPPISTFSNFKNWGGEIFYFFSEWEMIYKQHFHAVQYNMTIWHLNCGVEKLNHRVESVQERVKAMENHLLLGWGKCEKKTAKRRICIWNGNHLAKNLKATNKKIDLHLKFPISGLFPLVRIIRGQCYLVLLFIVRIRYPSIKLGKEVSCRFNN